MLFSADGMQYVAYHKRFIYISLYFADQLLYQVSRDTPLKVVDLYADNVFSISLMAEVIAEAAFNVAENLLHKSVSY